MNILVTGGAGFIGAFLTDRLLKEGHSVVIVDNLNTIGGIPYINPKAKFLNQDICDESLYSELNNYKLDAIYHLAAQSGGEPSYDNPKYDLLTNSLGTYLLAKFAKENNIPRFIYTSTVAIYGSNAEGDTKEDTIAAPDSIYGVSKLSGEYFIKQLLKGSKTSYSMFRVFNSYGPGEDLNYLKKGMVSIYASFIWRNEPIHVKGSLDRYRDFTYIEDTVDVLYLSLENSNTYNQIYNLSSGIKTIIRDLLSTMVQVSNQDKDYPIKEGYGTLGDSFGFHANIDKLRKDLNWEPKVQIKEGLEKYFQWIDSLPLTNDLKGLHPLDNKK
ncbi:NAD(P)-dependent oxidoreductase [Bacteriovoracaceae bacterium]|nr:NAD(P)-dependent oxidoreductase [Bacteriovoracaceae bacterium]